MSRQILHIAVSGLRYWLYLPKEQHCNGFPLLLFLHGSGERGNDPGKVKKLGPPKLIEEGHEFPFIIVSPQCRVNSYWQSEQLMHLIEELCNDHDVAKDRIYVSGVSMGGYGTWAVAGKYAETFAAIIPICGGGDVGIAKRLVNIPVWNFHGAKDDIVPVSESEIMVDAVRNAGGNVKFTIYPDVGHDSWTITYKNPDIYDWLLSHAKT